MSITLRDYQQEAVNTFFEKLGTIKRQLFSIPTGGGKTIIASAIAERFHNEITGERPILFIAHRKELLDQAADKMKSVWRSADVGIVKGKKNEQHGNVIVASTQTLVYGREILKPGLVIYDEAHHARAQGSMSFLEKIGVLGAEDVPMLGITATPMRSDKYGLGDIFQSITYQKSMLDMITDGYLCDVRAKRIEVEGLRLDNIKTERGDFSQAELGQAMEQDFVYDKIVDSIGKFAPNRKTVVFAVDVQHTYEFADRLNRAGIPTLGIDGSLPDDERESRLKAFRDGKVRVMVNCMILTEGFDQPDIGCIVVARPTKSQGLFVQMIGRGTRNHPDKKDLLVLDVVGVTNHKNLVTTPKLFATELDDSIVQEMGDEESILEFMQRVKEEEQEAESLKKKAVEVNLFSLNSKYFIWTSMDDGWYGLSCGDIDGFEIQMFLVPTEESYWPIIRIDDRVYRISERPLGLEIAKSVLETQFQELDIPRVFASKKARWRDDPITSAQKRLITSKRGYYEHWWTKGMAKDAIDGFKLAESRTWIERNVDIDEVV